MIREGVKIPGDAESKIPGLIELLKDDRDICALFLFGSLADGNLKPLSDLDFGILLSDRMDKKQRFEKLLDLIGCFTDHFKTEEIDLIDMRDVPSRITFNILKNGKLLFCNEVSALVNFQEKIVSTYLDFKSIRNQFDEIFLEGIGYHG